jgi:uncharacterized protein (DUF2461 family)
MSVKDTLQQLIDDLTVSLADAAKHERGNHAAGTRLRKTLQRVVHDCRELRQAIQDERSDRKA